MRMSYRISELDGLRGLAISLIFLYHLFPHILKGGFIGVSIFFILSGFFLYRSSMAKGDDFSPFVFYKHRFKSLYPSLIIFLFVTVLVFTLTYPEELQNVFDEGLSIIGNYNNWYQVLENQSYFTKLTASSPLTHLWFLSVLCQFYFLWPIIFYFLYQLLSNNSFFKVQLFLLVGIIISALLMAVMFNPQNPTRVYYGTDTRIFSFLIGVLLATQCYRQKNICINRYLIVSAVVLLIGAVFFVQGQASYLYHGGLVIIDLLIAVLIFGIVQSHFLAGLLNSKFFHLLGSISYEIYLSHYPIIYYINKNTDFSPSIKVTCITLLTLIISLFLFVLSKLSRSALTSCKNTILSLAVIFLLLFTGNLWVNHSPKVQQQKQLAQSFVKNQAKIKQGRSSSSKNEITIIGDSVTLGASPALEKEISDINVDAKEGRQVIQTQQIIENLEQSAELHDKVVIALGTNGPFTLQTGQQLIDKLGHHRQIYWVNVYGSNLDWQNDVNKTISVLVKRNSNVHLIDWYSIARNHPQWFYSDGIHLQPFAQSYYATLIKKGITQ